MNFFEHQDDARRNTRKLVLLFVAAVVALLVITNLVVAGVIWSFDAGIFQQEQARIQSYGDGQLRSVDSFIAYLTPDRVGLISLGVIGTILLVILFKRASLAGGGKKVAESLGGKKIMLNTNDADENKILNIVEEMAIASGVPVPPVFVMEEAGINAFAAGYSPNDAVIGVSRGSIKNLDRDQLQGVVAHEFSHILNGDMRLNINLIAVLAGILFIGHAGWFMVRAFGGGHRYHRSRSSKGNGSAIIMAGFALVVVGFIGAFFGNLIKAAVSRQREFLADASAVQFTRNPEGIAGALKKIGGSVYGSKLEAAKAEEMSHLFFGDAVSAKAVSMKVSSMFATHPPLDERISRIDPQWDGKFLQAETVSSRAASSSDQQAADRGRPDLAAAMAMGVAAQAVQDQAAQGHALQESISQVGQPSTESFKTATKVINELDAKIKQGLKQKESAKAIVYLLLLNEDKSSREKQWSYLQAQETKDATKAMVALLTPVQNNGKQNRLNLLELAVPALKEMSADEYKNFLKHIVFMVKADNTIDLFEWLLHTLLLHYLKPAFEKVKPGSVKYKSLKTLRNECRFLLSHLSYYGKDGGFEELNQVFDKGFSCLDMGSTRLLEKEKLQLSDLNNALHHFARLYPLVKPQLLKACAECIQADKMVTVEQFELFKVLTALLDCPMPALEIGQISG